MLRGRANFESSNVIVTCCASRISLNLDPHTNLVDLAMGLFEYLNYGCSILITSSIKILLRFVLSITRLLDVRIGLVPKSESIRPRHKFLVPSSKCKDRNIEVHLYYPSSTKDEDYPIPVHVNFHGSGFCLPCFGTDAELCTYIANRVGCVIVDADYAKAPRHPHPTAINDAHDVLAFIASKPETFDHQRVSVGGYSSGGNIAMLAAVSLPENIPLSIKAIVAWYAPTDLSKTGKKDVPWLVKRIHRATRQCYLPPWKDSRDPKISPLFEESALFPPTTLIVRIHAFCPDPCIPLLILH